MNLLQTLKVLALSAGILACNNEASTNQKSGDTTAAAADTTTASPVKEEAVSIMAGKATLNNYVYYDTTRQGKRPVVLVVPEWWGLVRYTRDRARQLAGLGFLAMAVDLYGDGLTANDPREAQHMSEPFYKDPQLARTRLDASLARAKTFPQADTAQTAVVGYCFGGTMALNAAYQGSDFNGVVVFHGGLEVIPPQKNKLKAKIFIAYGGADSFVPKERLQAVRKSLDSVGAAYTVKVYPNATHAFTNPGSTEIGKKFNLPIRYNAAADSASWNDMKAFFGQLFH